MSLFQFALILATFLCSLVAGFLFAFLVVVMPGIGKLSDGQFLRAFQVMDRVIQDNHPVFLLVWVGSIVVLSGLAVYGLVYLDGSEYALVTSATLIYLLGVQLPTFTINIPLNNKLQTLNVDIMDVTAQRIAREGFEPQWNRWNTVRTVFACLTSALLIVSLFQLP